MSTIAKQIGFSCPNPYPEYSSIIMAHGGGGTLSASLLKKIILPQFDNEYLNQEHDGAMFSIEDVRMAFSCDSYVVQPPFFPGGNIGTLAVNGTVNDLCMCGAKPMYISAGFILEEGYSIEELYKVVTEMKNSAAKADIKIVTGDTKVVEKGKGDKIYINTAGIGVIYDQVNINPRNCRPGDVIILNGSIAEHGIAVLSARNNLQFRTSVISDTAPLNNLIDVILHNVPGVHMMRDPTRGGLSGSLNEIARTAALGIEIDERSIPIKEEVKGICELLGFDPLYIANEGKVIVIADNKSGEKVLSLMRAHPLGKEAQIIGRVVEDNPGVVNMKTIIDSNRIVDMLSGEQLPRIC